MNNTVKQYLICDCDVPGYPMPGHGECSKCGFEMMDREDVNDAFEEQAIVSSINLLEKNGYKVVKQNTDQLCSHENTIDLGDSEHTVMVCTDCGR